MPPEVNTFTEQLATLQQNLVDGLSEDELRTLCFDVGVDYDCLPAEGKSGKARELVAHLERRKSIPEFIEICRRSRPDVVWPSALQSPQEATTFSDQPDLAGLYESPVVGLADASVEASGPSEPPSVYEPGERAPRVTRRYRWLALAVSLLIVLVALVLYAKPFSRQSPLEAGQAALERGDVATAIRELEQVTQVDPKQVEARVLLGRAYEKANRPDDAIGQYQAALSLQSTDPQVGFRLGALLVASGKPVEAAAPLAAGVKLNAGMAVSYTREISAAVTAGLAASSDLASKDPQQAAQILDAITTLDARNVRSRVLLGNLYVSGGQSQLAIEQYKAALALDPKNTSAITNMGAAYYQMGKLDDAIAQFQSALKQAPDDAETHYLLGAALIQQNKVNEALPEFQAAIKSNPNLAAAYIGLGNTQLLQNDLDGAVTSLNKAVQLAPSQPEALYALGRALMLKGDRAGALQALQRFLTLNPPANRRAEVEEWLKQLGQ